MCFRYFTVTSDVLTSVKKMEDSLKRLKKVRGTDKSTGNQGMSDDDKIRQQLILDISSYGKQVKYYYFSRSVCDAQEVLDFSDVLAQVQPFKFFS